MNLSTATATTLYTLPGNDTGNEEGGRERDCNVYERMEIDLTWAYYTAPPPLYHRINKKIAKLFCIVTVSVKAMSVQEKEIGVTLAHSD